MVETSHTSGFWPSLYEPFRGLGNRLADWIAPASEATENGEAYEITVELPGVKEDDIDITLNDNVLSVKGEKKSEREEKKGNVYFCERQYGSFQRSFRLPPDAAGAKIEADFGDGVLTLKIPRKTPDEKGVKKIAVKKTA